MPNDISGYWMTISGIITTNNNFYDLAYTQKLNQIYDLNFKVINASGNLGSAIYETSPIKLYDEDHKLIMQGKIKKKDYNDEMDEFTVNVNDDCMILFDRVYPIRQQFDNVDPTYIVNILVSGVIGVNNLEASGNLAPISFRTEHDSRLRAVASLAKITSCDWWMSYTSAGVAQLNFTTRKGISGVAETFQLGEEVFEIERQNKMYDTWNAIRVFGYGDGINQKQSYIYHTTKTQRTNLASGLLSGTGINVVAVDNVTNFNNSGILRVGIEEMAYTSRNTINNYFAGLSRGTNTTTIYLHNKGIECYDVAQYPITTADTSSQISSSIQRFGLKENAYTDRALRDQNTLDLLAQRLLTKYNNPSERIKISVAKQHLVSATIGDNIALYARPN